MARIKQPIKAKEPVRIRFKRLADGNQSIYLDCYRDGRCCYEFLKLYLIPETTPFDKIQNQETLKAANAIKAQKIIELANNTAGVKNVHKAKMLLVDWLHFYQDEQTRKGRKYGSQILNTIKTVVAYRGGKTQLAEVDKDYCLGYIEFLAHAYKSRLGTPLKSVTIHNYCAVLGSALNSAKRAEIITNNPFQEIDQTDKIRVPESKRVYLTADEVKRLVETDCKRTDIKRVFLFSCYCGLRISDIVNLKWENVITEGIQTRIEIVIQKTGNVLSLPLSDAAKRYLPTKGTATDKDKVFNLPTTYYINCSLKRWAKAAGITKNVSMHTARHTFATLLLTKDVNLKLIQDLMGHTDIKTTQIYAKIIDSKKVEAVNVLDEL